MIKRNWLKYIILVIGIFAIQFIAMYIRGDRGYLGNDSARYLSLANSLADGKIIDFLKNADSPAYLMYPVFLAGIIKVFGQNYFMVVICQMIVFAITGSILYAAMQTLYNGVFENMLLVWFFSSIFEIVNWNFILYSDAVALVWVALTVYLYVEYQKKKSSKILVALGGTLLVAFLARTNAFMMIGAIVLCLFLELEKKYKKYILIILGLVAGLFVILMVTGILGDYISVGKNYMKSIMESYYDGHYISYNTRTFYHIQKEHEGTIWAVGDVILIIIQRIFVYWYPIKENLSVTHTIVNIIQLMPMYILTVFSIVLIVRRKMTEYYFLIVCMFSYNIVQALMWMDCEYRYRIPVFIFMIVICQAGVVELRKQVQLRKQKEAA